VGTRVGSSGSEVGKGRGPAGVLTGGTGVAIPQETNRRATHRLAKTIFFMRFTAS